MGDAMEHLLAIADALETASKHARLLADKIGGGVTLEGQTVAKAIRGMQPISERTACSTQK